MQIKAEEALLLETFITAFSENFSLKQNWLITGRWSEACDKIISLLTGKLSFTTHNLIQLNKAEFSFPYNTAIISYQKGIEEKHALYYQQRFHATEVDDIITLKEFLFDDHLSFNTVHSNYGLLELFNLKHLLHEEVIKLSTGEARKAVILKALLKKPQVLILDNPFEGVDQKSLLDLEKLFANIVQQEISVIFFNPGDQIPSWISHVFLIDAPEQIKILSSAEFKYHHHPNSIKDISVENISVPEDFTNHGSETVKLKDVSVQYGDKTVLDRVNWTIGSREKWVLRGNNGAGKSTLLSLIYADHPQSYSNHIEVFGKKRGTGESVWDVKDNIGYYSPEFFYYFDKTMRCEEAILSGIYSHPYKKNEKYPALENLAKQLFVYFFSEEKLKTQLNNMSPVNQRVVLLIRALAKNAPLMLLDEPFQGYSNDLREKAKHVIDLCCKNKTLLFVCHNPYDLPESINKAFRIDKGKGRAEEV